MKPRSYTMAATSDWADLGAMAITNELMQRYGQPSPQQPVHITRIENVENNRYYQQQDIDLLVHSRNAQTNQHFQSAIEIKADTYPAGDLLHAADQGNFFFELVSNDTKNPRTPGCFVYCQADFLYYLFLSTGTLYTFPMEPIRQCVLKRIHFDEERFLYDPTPLTACKMPGLKATSTFIHGALAYRTWGVAIPIQLVLNWAKQDGIQVNKSNMLGSVYTCAQQTGQAQALMSKLAPSMQSHVQNFLMSSNSMNSGI